MSAREHMTAAGVCLLLLATSAFGQEGPKPILDTGSFWRCYYVLRMPVFQTDSGLVPLPAAFPKEWEAIQGSRSAKWLTIDSPQPPDGWMQVDFDDAAWCRMPGSPAAKAWVKGSEFVFRRSCYMASECRRGRFEVTDPSRAGELGLSVTYLGGLVVYVNGKEAARADLPKDGKIGPDALAEGWAEGKDPQRTLTVRLSKALLRKGVNILGLAIYRAPHQPGDVRFATDWTRTFSLGPTCGLVSVRLDAPKDAPVVPNVARPPGVQLWNSDLLNGDFDLDYGDSNEPLRPVAIVGALNGSFSGKVVLGSAAPLINMNARMSDLAQPGGRGRIPASAVRVRYGLPGVLTAVEGSIDIAHFYGGTEACAEARYLAEPSRFDALVEEAPKEVPVRKKQVLKQCLRSAGIEPSFGAVAPVWVTVDVPPNVPEGDYDGKLTVRADGAGPFDVPIRLHVCGWSLPEAKNFRTFVELVQSPESVALWYEVPLWSEDHFRLLERSLEWMGRAGAKTLYVSLICETNMGNAQTMVRWIRKDDGSYEHDYSIMDRYLDLAAKHLGRPEVVCFCVWDCFLTSVGREGWGTDAAKTYKGGPEVSLLDRAGGKTDKAQLPPYSDSKSKDLWEPVLHEIRRRMKARGLEDRMMLGLVSDRMSDQATTAFFKQVLPGIPWVSCSHNFPKDLHGVQFGYQANAYDTSSVLDPSVARQYGWRLPNLVQGAHFPRLTQDIFPLTTFRFMGEMNIARNYRGFARLGADFWPVLKDKRGRRVDGISARFPKSSWWNLNLITSLLSPGPQGAVATARYEVLREGVQECEARIFIERALADKDLRSRLGVDLSGRCQEVLDRRTRAMLAGVGSLIQGDRFRANQPNDWWQQPGIIGSAWFGCSNWPARTRELYAAAAAVARTLDK